MFSVLIVDDQPHILRVVKLGLEKQGHKVTTARHGEEAYSILLQKKFDVMITDMDMPKMDGRVLCEKIISESIDVNMKIFIVTAKTDIKLREWMDEQKGIVFLEKPLSLRMLTERLVGSSNGDSEAGEVRAAG